MTHVTVIANIQRADLSALPDVHSLTDDRQKVFWALKAAELSGTPDSLSAAEVADILTAGCGISFSRQRAKAILETEHSAKTVSRKKIKGFAQYQLMKKGADLICSERPRAMFIDPEKAFSGIRQAEEIFRGLIGHIRICDPYIDNKTLDYLAEFTSAAKIELLTVNAYETSKLNRDLKAFNAQHGNLLEIRVSQGKLHDRYILHDKGMRLIGTSLNGLGGKQSFIVALGQDISTSVSQTFSRHWNSSKAYP